MDRGIIDKRNYSDQIFNYLFDEIRAGRMKPGDRLPNERELSQTLGVSRPSLREALRAMNQLGLVRTTQGGGSYINDYDDDYLKNVLRYMTIIGDDLLFDLLQARKALEAEAARLAAIHATEEELAGMKEIVHAQEELLKNNVERVDEIRSELHRIDYDFHSSIAQASGNRVIAAFIETIHSTIRLHQSKTSEKVDLAEKTLRMHRDILDALKDRDPEKAAEKMYLHLQTVEDVLAPSADAP